MVACLTLIAMATSCEEGTGTSPDPGATEAVVTDSAKNDTVIAYSDGPSPETENPYSGMLFTGSLAITPPCGENYDPVTTIFARSAVPVPGNGSFATPYRTLAQVIERLQEDDAIETVCLRGEFSEELNLDWSILSSALLFYGYGDGAVLRPHTRNYVISNSHSSHFSSLKFSNLHIAGTGYGGVGLDYVDHVVLAWVTIDAQRFSYGIRLDSNGVVEVAGVEIWGSDDTYAAISSGDNDELCLHDVTIDAGDASYGAISYRDGTISVEDVSIEDSAYAGLSIDDAEFLAIEDASIRSPGAYAAIVGSDTIDVHGSRFSGYTYSGLHLEGSTVVVEGSILVGPDAYNGIYVEKADYTRVNNNFIRRHRAAGANVGNVSGVVNIFNNSFSDNHRALRTDNFRDHALTVTSYNNIFHSKSGQCAYDETHLETPGSSCLVPLPGTDEPFLCDIQLDERIPQDTSMSLTSIDMSNHDLRIVSDYNLFDGCVVMQNNREQDFADWTSTWRHGAHSKVGDPLFESESDLHIRSGSLAISSGKDLSSHLVADIDGDIRGEAFDIGADQYQMDLGGGLMQAAWK